MASALKAEYASLRQINLSLSDYNKSKVNSHEVRIDGKMYDVNSIKVNDDQTVSLFVLADEEEDRINEEINNILDQNDDQTNATSNSIHQLFNLIYLPNELSNVYVISTSNASYSSFLVLPTSSEISGIFIPPPETELV